MTPVEELTAAVATLRNTAAAATDPPWWSDESDQCWRLHGTHAWTRALPDLGLPAQPINKQILKAPKKGTPYAEYWPEPGDARWIVLASPAIAEPIAYWLELVAESMETDGDMYQPCGADEHALQLARLINRSEP